MKHPRGVKVHPVVIFSILDHYIRRNDGYRVIGTLTGTMNDGIIEIKNCYPVPHTEVDQVAVDMVFYHNMFELHHKVAPKEVIVGWYSTGSEINDASVMIHNDFYGKEMNSQPIHLTVDTDLTNISLGVKVYTNVNIVFNEKILGSQFVPVPVEIFAFDAEKLGVDAIKRGKLTDTPKSMLSDLDTLEDSMKKLLEMLDYVSDYVNKVLDGKVTPVDNKIGRFLADTISTLPKIDATAFEKMFSSSLQDLLLVVYLANLTRTQLSLAEKLQKII